MAVIVQLLNGTNQCRDAGFQAEKTAILDEGVRKNYLNELAVTTGQVDTGMAFVEITRDAVTPNETFMIPVWVTVATAVTTTGDGYIILRIDKDKVNDGSANAADGSGIATLEKVATLVGITDDYLVLATLASGVITDARTWAQISADVIEDPLYYDEDVGANDSYAISVIGVKAYIDGQRYLFKANTANTGAATLNVNSLGAKSIRKDFDSVLSDNDIDAGQIIDVIYDADNDWFQMQSPLANSPTTLNKATTGDAQTGTDDDKYMTPAKTKDAIDALSGNVKIYTFGEAIDGTTTPQACYLAAADGKVYKTDANDASPEKTFKFIGFTKENVSMNATGEVIEAGEVDGFPGATFTNNSDLYLSDTAGAISHTPSSTNHYKIARATSATSLIIEKGLKMATGTDLFNQAANGTTLTTDTTKTIGFRPKVIEMEYYVQGHGAAPGSAVYERQAGIAQFEGTVLNGNFVIGTLGANSDAANVGTFGVSATLSGNVEAGNISGTGALRLTITINSTSDTGFVIRKVNQSDNNSGNIARSAIKWKAWG